MLQAATVPLLSLAISLGLSLPLAWKWQLGVARAALVVGFGSMLAALVLVALIPPTGAGTLIEGALAGTASLTAAALFVLYRFYRDPHRSAPEHEGLVVSPADGEVVYVQRSEGGALPIADKRGRRYSLGELTRTPLHEGEATVIGIAMSFLDVHVNRAPIEGTVRTMRHFAGSFGSLRHPEMIYLNERCTTVIEGQGFDVAVVQIASRLVRQIVSFVGEGEALSRGQRLGVIRFGSQVDLVLPARADLTVSVAPGQRLRAGESVVARVERMGAAPDGV